MNVLKGATNVIKNFRPIFMCEVQDARTSQWGYSAFEICNFLLGHGYSWFELSDDGHFKAYIPSKAHNIEKNLFAIPNEKVGLIEQKNNNVIL